MCSLYCHNFIGAKINVFLNVLTYFVSDEEKLLTSRTLVINIFKVFYFRFLHLLIYLIPQDLEEICLNFLF